MKILSTSFKQVLPSTVFMSSLQYHRCQIQIMEKGRARLTTNKVVKQYHHRHHRQAEKINSKTCEQAHDDNPKVVNFPPNKPVGAIDELLINTNRHQKKKKKKKVVFVMGATGTGKSKLSIDLALHFHAEIINCDKMQVYKGLNILTNKVTEEEQCGVPHHLLGIIDPETDFTASNFRHLASQALDSITNRNRLPIIVGGSNSYIKALVEDKDLEFRSNYDCCFIWMDVLEPVLHSSVRARVDRMLELGFLSEVRSKFEIDANYNRGIRRAIGVPEMDKYMKLENNVDEETRARLLKEAINEIKSNTCRLATRQVEKIERLGSSFGWNLHRFDATDVLLSCSGTADEAWKKIVVLGIMVVERFLREDFSSPAGVATSMAVELPYMKAVATTTY